MENIVLNIEGMMCQGCVAGCKMALEDVAGVESVEVSLERKQAKVVCDGTRAKEEDLVAAVVEAGFTVV